MGDELVVNYEDMVEGYDDSTPDHGFMPEPLPGDLYPLQVEKIIRTAVSKNGSPSVSLLVRVFEGPYERRTALVEQYIGAGTMKSESDGQGGWNSVRRTPDEYAKARRNAQNKMNGFLSALGVDKGTPKAQPTEAEFIFQFYNVEKWVGKQFMGYLQKRGDNNALSAFYSLTDDKKGLEFWRREIEPKQDRKVNGVAPAVAGGGAATL